MSRPANRRLVRRAPRARPPRPPIRHTVAPDATTEPDPGPPPEAVFDRITGPHVRRASVATPGASVFEGT